MLFSSVPFLFYFLPAALLIYFAAPRQLKNAVLLLASLFFYAWGEPKYMLLMLVSIVQGYGFGLLIEKHRGQKASKVFLTLSILVSLGLLGYFKYADFFLSSVNAVTGLSLPLLKLSLPIGISFYTFQVLSYVIDVYRDKYAPEKNFAKLLLFVSFFPQMVQGPISRFNDLAPQLFARRSLDYTDLKYGIQLILWGYFKKMVIADRAAVLVNTVLDDPWSYSGSILAVGVLFYCIQLYGDFSGGIDIPRGVARLFGIDLAENFRRPLFSTSLTDFWRRWHITLGAWMRDSLFYPLSLSKPFGKLGKFTRKHLKGKLGKILPTSLATFLVYFVIGIWHGANWRYVAFGFWNGGIITLSLLLAPYFLRWKQALRINDKSKGWHLFQLVRTNLLVFFGRYITRAPRFLTAVWMVKETFLHPNLPDLWNGTLMTLGLGGGDFLILFLGVATLLLAEWYQEKKGPIRPMLERQSPFLQWVAILVPLVVLLRRAAGRLHLLGFYLQAILTTGGSHGFQTMAGLFSGYGSVAGGCRGRVQLLGGPLWGLFP